MLALERLKIIEERLNERGSIVISNLSETLNVSEETIRRDLEKLGKKINIKRVRGGAFLQLALDNEVPVNIREKMYVEEKQLMGAKCEQLIEDGDNIMLDSSTTALYVAKKLKISHKKVTVVTNSPLIVDELSENDCIKIICLGGNFRKRTNSFVGYMATEGLNNLVADKAFISCPAIMKGVGMTDNCEREARVRRLMLERSKCKFLIMDHTKFDYSEANLVCTISDIDFIITDSVVSSDYEQWFDENKVEIIYTKLDC